MHANAIINPGVSWAQKPVPTTTETHAARLAAEFAHLAPAIAATEARCTAAREARSTIETINDGPTCLGWHYKAAPGTPRSLLRTGWHAVGEPCPREVSDAILQEVADARAAYSQVVAPLWAAVCALVPSSSRAILASAVLWRLRSKS